MWSMPLLYERLTWPEVRRAAAEDRVSLIPVATLEDHGPHLPLGTDAMESREIARRTAALLEEMGIPIVVGPVIPFGLSSFHMDFPGTISLSSTTMLNVMKEVGQSLYRHGFRKFVLVHGHDGNLPIMQVAAQDLVDMYSDVTAVVLNWLRVLSDHYQEILTSQKGESHGGEGETARILVTHPELTHLDRAIPFYLEPKDLARIQSREHPKVGGPIFYGIRSYQTYTPVGSIGNGALATATTGEKAYAVITQWLASIIQRDLVDH